MPTVCLVLGGGKSTLQAVLSYVTSQPSVPVVVCDGSGRAADILAYAHQNQSRERDHPDAFKRHVFRMIEESFGVGELEAHKIYKTALLCSKWLNFSSIFSCDKDTNTTTSVESSNRNDLDCVILNTLLTGYKLSPVDKLGLLLTWNRDDMAREIFERGNHDWPENSLYQAMMYALVSDRVEFVQLLLNNGIAMDKFLTISRLEELYNTDRGPPNTLKFILQDVVKDPGPNYKFKLPHIGLIIEKLMGSGFRASYSRQDFRRRYKIYMCQKQQHRLSSAGVPKTSGNGFKTPADHVSEDLNDSRRFTFSTYNAGKVSHFQCPFAELFVWAVLTKRHNMAMCMWRQGDDQIAK
uniref:TRPM SLOG domain-containing protein n=1 Tax=Romanomermis culicivorax TaxID=13658 RepID=A0A915J5D5_ROMCU